MGAFSRWPDNSRRPAKSSSLRSRNSRRWSCPERPRSSRSMARGAGWPKPERAALQAADAHLLALDGPAYRLRLRRCGYAPSGSGVVEMLARDLTPNTLIKQGAKLVATGEDVGEELPSNMRLGFEAEVGVHPNPGLKHLFGLIPRSAPKRPWCSRLCARTSRSRWTEYWSRSKRN